MVLRNIVFLVIFLSSLWGRPLKVDIKASPAILINADTGVVLYAKNPDEPSYPASITKVATALYILEKYGHRLDDVVAASSHAVHAVPCYLRESSEGKHPPYRLEIGASSAGVQKGEMLSINALLYGLMLPSGNDAANVLAESLGGTIEQFMEELNAFFKVSGFSGTHFMNPHGLHHPNHCTTARDMAEITRRALRHPAFQEIVKTARYVRPQTNKQPPNYWVQNNRLLRQGPYFYPKAIGVKTGYTSKAGYTLVAAASHENRTLIAVLLNCAESHQRFREAIKLFEAAFSEQLVRRVLFAKEGEVFTHPMRRASALIEGVLKDDFIIEYYPAEEPSYQAEIHWLSDILPIKINDTIGFMRLVTPEGKLLLEKPIYAVKNVNQRWWVGIADFSRQHKSLFLALFLVSQIGLIVFYFLKKSQKISQR